jgi:hypothetical protein
MERYYWDRQAEGEPICEECRKPISNKDYEALKLVSERPICMKCWLMRV